MRPGGLLPESLRKAPVQNHGVFWSGASALNSPGNILRFAEVFLGEASALAVLPPPLGEIIIGMAIDGFGFESLHVAPVVVADVFRA